ncbi:Alpha-ketoglutarate-dependent dioxygenase [Erysiphe necator]|nr:Alpha-ketoglutarate-dependent dioxygenase [Erysiphe necator]
MNPLTSQRTRGLSGTSNPSRAQLNPHETPPLELRNLFKCWQFHSATLDERHELQFLEPENCSEILQNRLCAVFKQFHSSYNISDHGTGANSSNQSKIYQSKKIPGLSVASGFLPPIIQKELLSRLLHRDLSNPEHNTNLHLHYNISYPAEKRSFFSENPLNLQFYSKDKNPKKNLDCRKALQKKLRWITLGGQYDWSRKDYPLGNAPKFPSDISSLIVGLFPNIQPQAAIVNLYSPGDTLSLHRDVSEKVDRGLVSISLGCSAYFIIGIQDEETMETKSEVLYLHSGDVVCMTEESRFAWHGVPLIIENTCPEYLSDWPGEEFPAWKKWISQKRVNLNVRQIWD